MSSLPFFYIPGYTDQLQVTLDADTSRHIVQVLRMREGEELQLTDGKGNLMTAVITEADKKRCVVKIKEGTSSRVQGTRKVSIAISLLKNSNRFEWFLEKATELGVNEIIPLLCERTEKERFRYDRMQAICISAMLQSQQCWLPLLKEPQTFASVVTTSTADLRLVAHCMEEGERKSLASFLPLSAASVMVLIGPEGDFTPGEIQQALQQQFLPVTLGETRLRTETAGVAAATILCLG